jgi:predicted TIM-barrel fold metal-dependent hydrolase
MDRRTFLRAAASAAAALGPWSASAQSGLPMVDTHTHFYDPTRPQGVPWPDKKSPLHRRVFPDDWAQLAAPLGVTSVIAVEASIWVEDNQWLLDLAKRDPRVAGVVGNLDPLATEFTANLRRFAQTPGFLGIRNGRISAGNDTLLADPGFRVALKQMADLGVSLDLHTDVAANAAFPAALAGMAPGLPLILNHLGGAREPQRPSDAWKSGIRLLGKHPLVFCKISGLMAPKTDDPDRAPQDTGYYAPVLEHLWENFGENRLLYGSNWPVSHTGASHAALFRVVQEFFRGKGAGAEEKAFVKNARAAYRRLASAF